MQPRALVTGANGFLGRALSARLHAEGWRVVRAVRRAPNEDSGDTLVLGMDAWTGGTIVAALAEAAPDVVFHLAGSPWAQPVAAMYETNVMLAARLLDAAAAMARRPGVVLVGSAAEYGFVSEDRQPVTEDSRCAPYTHHGIAKHAQTQLGLACARAGMPVLIARLFNLVGSGMPSRLALASFAAQIRAGTTQLRVGDLDVARDFIDVTEAARLIAALAAQRDQFGQVINICSGTATALRPLVEELVRLAERPIEIVVDPARLRPGEMPTLCGDTSKLRALGYRCPGARFRAAAAGIVARRANGRAGMNRSRQSPNLLQRLQVLRDTITRDRLILAREMMQNHGLRVLLTQFMLHTSYRWRMRQGLGSEIIPDVTDAAADPHQEDVWPAGQPLVSVIIPCFNYGSFVADAVDSVLAQTLRDVEIIVVEGGSTDGITPAVVRALDRPRTTVLFRDQPHRVGDNRNYGIRHARGRYICCLDADDMIRPTYLEKAVFLLEYAGYDVVSTSVRRFGAVDEVYGVMPAPALNDLLQGNQVTTCAVFRRALWEQVGGYEDSAPSEVFLHEDWRFWIRLACEGARFRNITGEQLFCYRAHENGSLSTGKQVLPDAVQAPLLRQAESEWITEEALTRSHEQAERRLRAPDGPCNLLARGMAEHHGRTILVAMPFLVLGGAERLMSEILRHLRSVGYRIIVISTLQSLPDHGDTTAWFEPATDEIYHLWRFLAPAEFTDFIDYVLSAKHVDALWIVGSTLFYEALPRLRERLPQLRVVDLLFNTLGHVASNRRHAALIDLILVENDEVRRWLLLNGESEERIRLIPSGIDLNRYNPVLRSRRMAETLGIAPGRFIAGFSGRLSEEKAPLAFVGAARRLADADDIVFVMTGAGPMEGAVRKAVAALHPAGRLHYLGIVPEVRDWLACYDVLVVPSEIDGRPTVVLEALAMGVPVIASAVGGLPELVHDGETGFLCPPGDDAAFADAIRRLHADPELHGRMRAAARNFAERELRFERTADAYAAAFDALLARRQDLPQPAGACGGSRGPACAQSVPATVVTRASR